MCVSSYPHPWICRRGITHTLSLSLLSFLCCDGEHSEAARRSRNRDGDGDGEAQIARTAVVVLRRRSLWSDEIRMVERCRRHAQTSGMAIGASEASRVIGAPIVASPSRRSRIAGDRLSSPGFPRAVNGCSPIERACSRGIIARRPASAAISELEVPEPSSSPRPVLVPVEEIPPWLRGIIAGRPTSAAISGLTVPKPSTSLRPVLVRVEKIPLWLRSCVFVIVNEFL
ncbi:hypothetical protein TIFTF001_005068 [Ficus carica]|uniref:Secreted protein n=1 Tax=Ficus carica TaxID=3494 RepID=A0AA88CX24_FICCA|nr:hypothetical protein TIFTF001_005068 [Ficus carica]